MDDTQIDRAAMGRLASALTFIKGAKDPVAIALKAAADQIEPCTDGPEGLIPIRARILARAGVPWPQAFALSRYWLGPK